MRTQEVIRALLLVVSSAALLWAQTEKAYQETNEEKSRGGLLDPSRLTIHHSASFGMSTSDMKDIKSQSLYATMLQYKFSRPVTLNLSFGLPIHSTYDSRYNLNQDNLKSAEYFKSMPFDATLTWKPRDNMRMSITVARYTAASTPMTNPSLNFSPLGMFGERW